MATRVKQRDPLHSWYPHEGLYPQPIRLTSHRLLIVCLLAVGLGGTIGVIVVILSSGRNLLTPLSQLAISGPILLAFGGIFLMTWYWKARARRKDYSLCLQCGHCIGNQGETGTCPKCNHEFVLEQTRWGWQRVCGLPVSMVPPGSPEGTPPAGPAFGGIPRPVRNMLVICYGFLVVAAVYAADLISWVLSYFDPPDMIDRVWAMVGSWITFLFVGLVMVAFFGHLRLWRRKAQRLNYHLCVYCAYSLEGLDETGQCPECGTEYSFAGCERVWRKFCRTQLQLPKDG